MASKNTRLLSRGFYGSGVLCCRVPQSFHPVVGWAVFPSGVHNEGESASKRVPIVRRIHSLETVGWCFRVLAGSWQESTLCSEKLPAAPGHLAPLVGYLHVGIYFSKASRRILTSCPLRLSYYVNIILS